MEFVIKRDRRRQRAGLEPYCTGIWLDEWYVWVILYLREAKIHR